MPAGLKTDARSRALKALEDARAFVQGVKLTVEGDAAAIIEQAGGRVHQANAAFVLALLKDEECPAELFAPWASARRIRDWRDDGVNNVKLRVVIKHGRCCVRPSDFFAFWKTLPDETT